MIDRVWEVESKKVYSGVSCTALIHGAKAAFVEGLG